ncbi:YwiC-like family protein [Bacillus mojavensis]|uniref:YwiC-like family protein n=1 Tax=Bacillus mojavensis TaxID=72360 RepID=A0AAP3CTB3_BACMO|nr:YwiC-like family protein [Bacillus mojavensis]MCY8510831.1 YwiC-like family protein [Bacillus mojavensis]MEC1775309.1 YwiC-like family protein [Bacillus mojavensis]
MKALIPKQHGAWAMLLIPFCLGTVKGGAVLWHIPLFLGWLFLYLAVYPVTLALKKKQINAYQKWIFYYSVPACSFLFAAVIHKPSFIWLAFSLLPLFLIHVYYARRKNERALLNDFAGVFFFCAGGLASCWLGTETLDGWAWFIFAQSSLFFIGSSFYVKSVIREKNNRGFAYWSWGYHLLLPLLSAAFGAGWAVLAFIPSSLRAWFFHGKKWPVQTIGILEIVNACFFFAIMCIWLTR